MYRNEHYEKFKKHWYYNFTRYWSRPTAFNPLLFGKYVPSYFSKIHLQCFHWSIRNIVTKFGFTVSPVRRLSEVFVSKWKFASNCTFSSWKSFYRECRRWNLDDRSPSRNELKFQWRNHCDIPLIFEQRRRPSINVNDLQRPIWRFPNDRVF